MKKKILVVLLTLATVFTFAGCKKKNKKTDPNSYITPDVEGNLLENGNFNYGEVELASSGDQLIKTEGGGEWWLYALNGGFGQMKINDKRQVEVGVVMTGKEMHCVQFAYDGFAITKGSKYKFEFDASCDIERSMEVRIQQNGAPYENYILEGKSGNLIDKIGTTMKHYTYEFTSAVTDASPRMALNLGWFEGEPQYKDMPKGDFNPETGEMLYPHYETITLDNFSVVCTYDSGIVIDPLDLASRPKIVVNQLGYKPNQTKEAVFRADKDTMDEKYSIINVDTNEVVKNGSVSIIGTNSTSLEYVGVADFSTLTEPGRYKVTGKKCGESVTFVISDTVYNDVTADSIMMLYRQRCGVVQGEDNDPFKHAACHQEKATILGTDTKIDVTGGWHDAGDYGKYVVAGAQTVADLLVAYENYGDRFQYPTYVTGTDANIPDILEEAIYELDWMLKMQKDNGQVYHKVTSLDFAEMVNPVADNKELLVFEPSYAATADFAAVMAMAARTLRTIDPTRSAKYLDASEKAFAALATMTKTSFKNPDIKGLNSGEYPDSELNDELAWASIELYAATGEENYLTSFKSSFDKNYEFGLGWANVNGFALYTAIGALMPNDLTNLSDYYKSLIMSVLNYADTLVARSEEDAYNITIESFEWGSNLSIASNGMILDFAAMLGEVIPATSIGLETEALEAKVAAYTKVKQEQLNYLLGQNACAYCFVTGYGYKSEDLTLTPVNPHHRPSIVANQAMPGMLVGGPDSNFAENGNDTVATRSCANAAPAHCYIDNNNSWSTNEVTIYWNSPFIYLLLAA